MLATGRFLSLKLRKKIRNALESLVEMGSRLVFLNGGMGQFDALCASAVRSLKKRHPEKEILSPSRQNRQEKG